MDDNQSVSSRHACTNLLATNLNGQRPRQTCRSDEFLANRYLYLIVWPEEYKHFCLFWKTLGLSLCTVEMPYVHLSTNLKTRKRVFNSQNYFSPCFQPGWKCFYSTVGTESYVGSQSWQDCFDLEKGREGNWYMRLITFERRCHVIDNSIVVADLACPYGGKYVFFLFILVRYSKLVIFLFT